VIYDLKHGKVLTILENRLKDTVMAWFRGQSKEWRQGVRRVAIDMWGPYEDAVKEVLGEAVMIVADKFHVTKQLGERMNEARREIQREATPDVREKLKGIRWAILKNPKKLTKEERGNLGRALKYSSELRRMYELRKEFTRIYNDPTPRRAIRRLRGWMKKVHSTNLTHLHKFVKTLQNWWEEVTNYFRCGWTSAACEGLNCTIKLVHRRGYGFRNHEHFLLRVRHETGGLAA
jgi:transposase